MSEAMRIATDSMIMSGIGIVILIASTALMFEYVDRRWTWIPRKRGTRKFTERF